MKWNSGCVAPAECTVKYSVALTFGRNAVKGYLFYYLFVNSSKP